MTKDKLIDKYRDINTDYEWWDCTESDLVDDLTEIGFSMDQMYFSGFCSQGDGACFTGVMREWGKFVEKTPSFVEAFPNTANFLALEGGEYTISHRDRYCHEYSTSHEYRADIEDEIEALELVADGDALDYMKLATYKAAMREDGDSVEKWLTEHFRDKMRMLYKTLEAEYNYLTSDETVWETLEANDMTEELDDGE